MSTDPISAREPDRAPYEADEGREAAEDRETYADQERPTPMSEYPEASERVPADADDSDAGFEHAEHEHVLGSREEREEEQEEAQRADVAPVAASSGTVGSPSAIGSPDATASQGTAASPDAFGTGRFGETGGAAADGTNGYGSTGDSAMDGAVDGGRDDVVIEPDQNTGFRDRWREIQAEFIEDPRRAAKDADELVAEITKVFAAQAEERRNRLATSWQGEGTHGTEELRLVMRHYRGLVDHMLDQ